MKDRLAINGGEKTIDKTFPWPIYDEKEVKWDSRAYGKWKMGESGLCRYCCELNS